MYYEFNLEKQEILELRRFGVCREHSWSPRKEAKRAELVNQRVNEWLDRVDPLPPGYVLSDLVHLG